MRPRVNKICHICHRKFSKAEHLSRHLRSHERHKPFRCTLCGKCYGRRDVLQRHERDQHARSSQSHNRSTDITKKTVDIVPEVCPQNHSLNSTLSTAPEDTIAFSEFNSNVARKPWITEEIGISPLDVLPAASCDDLNSSDWPWSSIEPSLADNAAFDGLGLPNVLSIEGVADLRGTQVEVAQLCAMTINGKARCGSEQNSNDLESQSLLGTSCELSFLGTSLHGQHPCTSTAWICDPKFPGTQTIPAKGTTYIEPGFDSQFDHEPVNTTAMAPTPTYQWLDCDTWATGGEILESIDWSRHRSEDRRIGPLSIETVDLNLLCHTGESMIPDTRPTIFFNSYPLSPTDRIDNGCGVLSNAFNFGEESRLRLMQHLFPRPTQYLQKEIPSELHFNNAQHHPKMIKHFPSLEALSACLDVYFREFHVLMPFIHRATFDAHRADPTLLASMCLVGLIFLGEDKSMTNVGSVLRATIEACQRRFASDTLWELPSFEILNHLAAAMLLLCACHMIPENPLDAQARSLYLDSLSLLKQHGLFHSQDFQSKLNPRLEGMSDLEKWQAWACAESAKRSIVCIFMGDAFFSHKYEVEPILSHDLSEWLYILPSPLAAFEASNPKSWIQALPTGHHESNSSVEFQSLSFPISIGDYEMHGILTACWAQVSKSRRCSVNNVNRQFNQCPDTEPSISGSDQGCKAAVLLSDLYNAFENRFSTLDPNCLISWHNACMHLASDFRVFQDASDKSDPLRAQQALHCLEKWSRTLSARRACLHAAQTFRIMSQHHWSSRIMFQSESALFESALVLGFYLYLQPEAAQNDHSGINSSSGRYEILDDALDWTLIGPLGLQCKKLESVDSYQTLQSHFPQPYNNDRGNTVQTGDGITVGSSSRASRSSKARDFILYNSYALTFEATACPRGFTSAQRVFVVFCSLLKKVAPWNTSRYCQLLRILSNIV